MRSVLAPVLSLLGLSLLGPPLLGLPLLAGCSDREVSRVDPIQDPVFDTTIPVTLNRDLDILFVVDNSGSMEAEQQQLAANFPQFINVLQQIEGGLPNLHLGILSSNVGAAGAAAVPGCAASGDDGNLLTGPPGNTCAADFGLQGSFVADLALPDGSRQRNYTGDLAGMFSCMAQLGTTGCGFEMHLESMWRALQTGKNPGFYRPDAWLAVIFIADEDDCSTEMGAMFGDPSAGLTSQLGPRTSFRCHEFGVQCDDDPSPRAFGPRAGCRPRDSSQYMFEIDKYVDFLRRLKDDPSLVIVAGIIGNFDAETGELTVGPDPSNATFPSVQKSCFTRDPGDPNDGAAPPVRLQAFLSSFPERNTFTTICNDNLSDGMTQVAELLRAAIGTACIDSVLADRNPLLDGVQPECSVVEVTDPRAASRAETVIPQCEQAMQPGATSCDPGNVGLPCWCIRPDPEHCIDEPQHQSLDVVRGGVSPPAGTVLEVQCVAD